MRRSDAETLDGIIRARGDFGHREHLELAWTYVNEHPIDYARDAMRDAIRHVAQSHGAADKYHETITQAWLQCVAVHAQRWPADGFDAFIERNQALLDRNLLGHFYSSELIGAEAARATWVDPDRSPLPALTR